MTRTVHERGLSPFSLRAVCALVVLSSLLAPGAPSLAQDGPAAPASIPDPSATVAPLGPTRADATSLDGINPITILNNALEALPKPSRETPIATPAPSDPSRSPGISSAVSILVLLTVISLAPSIMLMTTCFLRISIVLGLLRQAIGTQTVPPAQVTLALSL